jgi:hypothetical protein
MMLARPKPSVAFIHPLICHASKRSSMFYSSRTKAAAQKAATMLSNA